MAMTVLQPTLYHVESEKGKLYGNDCIAANPGFEINARPLARGEWKPRGMSRIFAQVVRRASGYFNLFCQLCVTMNETNY